MPTLVEKHIGLQASMPTGITRDFDYINGFDNWISAQSLIAQDINVIAHVHQNQVDVDIANTYMHPSTYDATRNCVVRPAVGKGWRDLNTSGAVDYYTTGIELAWKAAPTGRIQVGNGVVLEGFRIKIQDSGTPTTAGQSGLEIMRNANDNALWPNTVPGKVRKCLILSEVTNSGNFAVRQGLNGGIGQAEDCVFFQGAGAGSLLKMHASMTAERNSYVKRGTATGCAIDNGLNTTSIIRNNLFFGCSDTPVILAAGATAANIYNNYTNVALLTAHAGIIFNSNTIISATDARPNTGSPIINGASTHAQNTNDVRGTYRGQSPDVGGVQLSEAVPPPTGVKNTQTLNGQSITATVTTTGTPTSATSSLTATGNGGVTQTPVVPTLAAGTASVQYSGAPSGDYILSMNLTSANGTAAVTGITPISIIGVAGGGNLPVGGAVVAPTDTTAPQMVGAIAVASFTSSGFTIAWEPATDAFGVTGYEISINSGAYLPKGLTRTHTYTGLAPNTTHTIAVRAFDQAGNTSTTLTTTATTAAPADITKPGVISGLSISNITHTGFRIHWLAASDNVGVEGYQRSINNGPYDEIGPVLDTTYSGLEAATQYPVRIRAFDLAGNFADPVTLLVTTNALPYNIKRAQVLINGEFVQISTADIGTGKKALVFINGRVRQRIAGEGVPVVKVGGRFRRLASGETLEI